MNRANAVEIVARTLAHEQLLYIRQTVVGSSGVQREGACLLARLSYQDGESGLELRTANDIGKERGEQGKAIDGRGGHQAIDGGEVQRAFAYIEEKNFEAHTLP
jgi:hypothetical protein